MAWKSLLVHLKPYSDGNAARASAIEVAKTFDASLTGMYPIRELAMLKLIIGQDSAAVREAEARDAPSHAALKKCS